MKRVCGCNHPRATMLPRLPASVELLLLRAAHRDRVLGRCLSGERARHAHGWPGGRIGAGHSDGQHRAVCRDRATGRRALARLRPGVAGRIAVGIDRNSAGCGAATAPAGARVGEPLVQEGPYRKPGGAGGRVRLLIHTACPRRARQAALTRSATARAGGGTQTLGRGPCWRWERRLCHRGARAFRRYLQRFSQDREGRAGFGDIHLLLH